VAAGGAYEQETRVLWGLLNFEMKKKKVKL